MSFLNSNLDYSFFVVDREELKNDWMTQIDIGLYAVQTHSISSKQFSLTVGEIKVSARLYILVLKYNSILTGN